MSEHVPEFRPCKRGLFRVFCSCKWRSTQKFKTVNGAEAFWVKHVNGEIS